MIMAMYDLTAENNKGFGALRAVTDVALAWQQGFLEDEGNMSGKKALRYLVGVVVCLIAVLAPDIRDGRGAEDWRNLYLDAKPILDVRYRFEFVEQDGFSKDAKANTIRTRVGLETGRLYGMGIVFDAEWIQAIGSRSFNDTINGKTQFPVVADPDDEQINQFYIVSENTIPETLLKLGRQRIIWDNHRFIGNVGFRQNEQTFDAFRGTVTAIPFTVLEYAYLDKVNRVFGTKSPVGDFGLNSHGIRAQYLGFEFVTITPFALLLDFDPDNQAQLDSQSYGVILGGSRSLDDHWRMLYEASLAYQADYADNPSEFDLWYYRIEPGIGYDKTKLNVGYEVLEGNGINAFQTPLATLHKFNGLTDQFLTTPPDGLRDFYLSLDAPLPGEGWLSDLTVKAEYHQFWAENVSSHYGWEWAAGIFKKYTAGFGTFNLGLQFASYNADNFSRDTNKLWLTLNFQINPTPLRDHLKNGN